MLEQRSAMPFNKQLHLILKGKKQRKLFIHKFLDWRSGYIIHAEQVAEWTKWQMHHM